MLILVTGATGKVGRTFIDAVRGNARWKQAKIRALCHNRTLPEDDQLSVVKGSIADRAVAEAAMRDVTHVVHLATCKETPEDVVDVAVGGLFWLLEAFRNSKAAKQFMLIGGDAAIGHFFYRHPGPITEATPHMAYPGCYALSKVLEEVMLQQYWVQYGIDGCILRAPWIMEKDDFKHTLSFGDDVFGGPVWKDLVPPADAKRYAASGTVPLLLDADKRAAEAELRPCHGSGGGDAGRTRQSTGEAAALQHLHGRAGRLRRGGATPPENPRAAIGRNPSDYHSNWMDNAKAKDFLGWRPHYDLAKLIDVAYDYKRAADDPRKVWYPG